MKRKKAHKSKASRRRGVVRGPQLNLPERTPKLDTEYDGTGPKRRRYIEPPARKRGNPFFAVRVPADVLSAFKRKAKPDANQAVRRFMSRVAGVALSKSGAESGDE